MDILHPSGWTPPKGYSNGVVTDPGRLVFIAGQVGLGCSTMFPKQ